jgi:hypothetical protein
VHRCDFFFLTGLVTTSMHLLDSRANDAHHTSMITHMKTLPLPTPAPTTLSHAHAHACCTLTSLICCRTIRAASQSN